MNYPMATKVAMNSRDIADLTGKQHKHVLEDIDKMLAELGVNSAEFSAQYKDSTGRTLRCYNLPPREVLVLVSGYSIPLRARIIDRLNELERNAAYGIPSDYPAALRLAAEQAEVISVMAPKAAVYDQIAEAKGTKDVNQVAHILGVGEKTFRDWMQSTGITFYREGVSRPYRQYEESGYFECKESAYKKGGKVYTHTQIRFTAKGELWIAKRWRDGFSLESAQ